MNKSKGHLKASTVVKINNLAQSVGWPIVATILGLLLGAVIIILYTVRLRSVEGLRGDGG